MLAMRSCSKPYSFNRLQRQLNHVTFARSMSMGRGQRLAMCLIQDLATGILIWGGLAATFVGSAYLAGVIQINRVEVKQEDPQTEPTSSKKLTQEELQHNRRLLVCLLIAAVIAKILQGED